MKPKNDIALCRYVLSLTISEKKARIGNILLCASAMKTALWANHAAISRRSVGQRLFTKKICVTDNNLAAQRKFFTANPELQNAGNPKIEGFTRLIARRQQTAKRRLGL
tara:strand:- start:14122 stop:14448 length:327 start_codon:yes stop_codon:yes gene_type:complete